MAMEPHARRRLTTAWTAAVLLTAVVSRPAVGQNDGLTHPEAAMRAGIQGAVVLQVDFDERGRATASTALSGPPALTAHSPANLEIWSTGWLRSTREILVPEYRIEQGLCRDDSQTLTLHRLPGLVSVIACRRLDADAPPSRPALTATQTGGEERYKVLRFEDNHFSLPAAAALLRGVVVVEVMFDEEGVRRPRPHCQGQRN